jgi:hypothetical protein
MEFYYLQWAVFDEPLENEPCDSKVVLQVMALLLNQGYCVTMDNWFSSPDMFHKLCSKQTDAMGTSDEEHKTEKGSTCFSLQID